MSVIKNIVYRVAGWGGKEITRDADQPPLAEHQPTDACYEWYVQISHDRFAANEPLKIDIYRYYLDGKTDQLQSYCMSTPQRYRFGNVDEYFKQVKSSMPKELFDLINELVNSLEEIFVIAELDK